jgi:hypothetical protein
VAIQKDKYYWGTGRAKNDKHNSRLLQKTKKKSAQNSILCEKKPKLAEISCEYRK